MVEYDSHEDVITIRSVSKLSYLENVVMGFVPDEHYQKTPGHNFLIPFSLVPEYSNATNYLGFYAANGCIQTEKGVSHLMNPPPVLYLVIPEIEGDIVMNEDFGGKFANCSAVLYLGGDGT